MKVTRMLVFGAGYVLGAKAGRERYAQIVAAVQSATKGLEKYGNSRDDADDYPTGVVDTSVPGPRQQ